MKFTSKEKSNGELAMRKLSSKAAEVYADSFPLDVYENENGTYSMRGIFNCDGLTFEEVESMLEENF